MPEIPTSYVRQWGSNWMAMLTSFRPSSLDGWTPSEPEAAAAPDPMTGEVVITVTVRLKPPEATDASP